MIPELHEQGHQEIACFIRDPIIRREKPPVGDGQQLPGQGAAIFLQTESFGYCTVGLLTMGAPFRSQVKTGDKSLMVANVTADQ